MTYASAITALADPTRREIFERLRAGPSAVNDLASRMPVSRPAVSQHLKVLLDANLVRVRPEGARRVYEIESAGLLALREYFDGFWDAALENFKREAER